MEIRLFRGPDGAMHPCLQEDMELIRKLAVGEIMAFKARKPRNGIVHRRFFKMLRVLLSFTEKYESVEHILTEIKVRMGYYEHYVRESGEVVFIPKSIDFDTMDDPEFQVFYDKAVDIIFAHIIPGVDEELLQIAMEEMVRFDRGQRCG